MQEVRACIADPNAFADLIGDTDIFDLLDEHNTCIDPGGHVFLADCGCVKCIHCEKVVA